jgi:serine/threonine protein kinase
MNLIEQTLKSRDYELLEEIGQGSFASVYKALNKKTNDFVAIKKIFKREKYDDIFKREIEIMQKVNDEHSLKFIEFFEDEKNYYLILELCDTDLNAYLNFRNKGLEIDAIKNILNQLNSVFKLMINKKIVHRDLKLQNILLTFTNIYQTEYIVKLCDYGISRELSKTGFASTKAGSDYYMAPEIYLENQKYTNKADIWSLGVAIYEMYFNEKPFRNKNDYLKGKLIKLPEDNQLKDLIQKMIKVDLKQRISWDEYFNHPFLIMSNNENNNNTNNDNNYNNYNDNNNNYNDNNYNDNNNNDDNNNVNNDNKNENDVIKIDYIFTIDINIKEAQFSEDIEIFIIYFFKFMESVNSLI